MCYATCGPVAPAPASNPPADAFVDDVDAFAWLDALDDDLGLVGPSADESAESSQIKMEGSGASVAQQQQQQQVMGASQQAVHQQAVSWPMAMAMAPFPPMYAAPWMGMAGAMMAPPQMVAPPPMPAPQVMAPPQAAPAVVAPKVAAPPPPAPKPAVYAPPTPAPQAPASSSDVSLGEPAPPMSKARKSQAEMDEAIERIKQKRRESAQRSRNRRAAYMKQLENENKALRDEVSRLRAALGGAGLQAPFKLQAGPAAAAALAGSS